jgi:hypothetical protein
VASLLDLHDTKSNNGLRITALLCRLLGAATGQQMAPVKRKTENFTVNCELTKGVAPCLFQPA